MKKILLILFVFSLSYQLGFGQCSTKGFYYYAGWGTNFNKGTSITMEFGMPDLRSHFYMTGVLNFFTLENNFRYYGSYGIQLNRKFKFGNNNLIQYLSIMNSYDNDNKKSSFSGALGVKWLQRLKPDGNVFLVGKAEYLNMGFLKTKTFNTISTPNFELGTIIIL